MKKIVKGVVRGLLIATVIVAISLLTLMVIKTDRMQLKLNELASQLLYLQDSLTVIQSDLANMESNIEATLEQETSLVEDCRIQVKDCDFSAGTYDVDITVIPKEYNEATQICIYFGTIGFNLELKGISFKGSATLSMNKSYDGNVTILFTNGEKRNTEVLHNYVGFQTALQNALWAELVDVADEYEDEKWHFSGSVNYELDGQNQFEYKTLRLIAQVGQNVVYDYDLIRECGGTIQDETEASTQTQMENGNLEVLTQNPQIENEVVDDQLQNPQTEHEIVDELSRNPQMESEQELEKSATDTFDLEASEQDNTQDESAIFTENLDDVYISGTAGEHFIEFDCTALENELVKIFLSAETEEGYKLNFMLLEYSFCAEDGERFHRLTSYRPDACFYDRKNVLWK